MAMHLVFFHRGCPGQFGPVIQFLLKHYDDVKISFFSEFKHQKIPKKVQHYPFQLLVPQQFSETSFFFSRNFELDSRSILAIYEAVEKAGLEAPDVFIGHVGFGNLLFLHSEYPQVKTVGYFEILYNPFELDKFQRPEFPAPKHNILRIPLRNAIQMLELEYCDKCYSPTYYQRSTYPEAYQNKLAVLFDGVDTKLYRPGKIQAKSELKPTWPPHAKVVTYVARGLESFRGFDIFMEVAHRVSKKHPDVHFVIVGEPLTHYGTEGFHIGEQTFKEYVLKRHRYDLNRFHFLNWISESVLADLYRLSDCHFYWTIPYTLSWSFFQSMSTGAILMGSQTAPVEEVLKHGENGLLVEPYNIDSQVEQMLEILREPQKYNPLRKAARETILQNYSFEVCLPRLAEFYLK